MHIAFDLSIEWRARLGLLAPVVLGVYLWFGSRLRIGYDPWRETMSALGDGVDFVALAFPLVNLVIGMLLALFAGGLPVDGWLARLVLVTAIGSVVIGVSAGHEHCVVPGIYGRPPRGFHLLHVIVGGLIVTAMSALPWLTLKSDLGNGDAAYRRLQVGIVVVLPLVAFAALVLSLCGRSQLGARLVGRRSWWIEPHPAPTKDPRLWLDQFGLYERAIWIVGYGWVVSTALVVLRASMWFVAVYVAFAVGGLLTRTRIRPLVRFEVEGQQRNTVYGVAGAQWGSFHRIRIDKDATETVREGLRVLIEGENGEPGLVTGETRRSRVSSASHVTAVTVGLSASGVDKLTPLAERYQWHGPREDKFSKGMAASAELLGDDPAAADWRDIDAAIWIYSGAERDKFESVCERVIELFGKEPPPISLRPARGSYFPIGVRDGISQPWVMGVPAPRTVRRNGRGTTTRGFDPRGGGKIRGPKLGARAQQPLALGEFVLGQVDESNDVFPVPEPTALFLNATFATVRQLHVSRERADVAVLALGGVPDDAVAGADNQRAPENVVAESALVGRTYDGMPLMLRKGDWDSSLPETEPTDPPNRFRYGSDPFGLKCPVGAHIRRANPRDSIGFDGVLSNRHRMIRRGMGYVDSDGALDGLLFIALHARIEDQFEFVQRQWLNDGDAFGLGLDPDLVAGQWMGERQVVLPSRGGPPRVAVSEAVTRCLGGEYFVVPSMRGLRYLVDVSASAASKDAASAATQARA